MTCLLCPKKRPRVPGRTSRKIGRGCAACFIKPLPYFKPKSVIFPTLFQIWSLEPRMWQERVTICYGRYTVVGVNNKREMVLSPNDKEVASSSKKEGKFKTRVYKPYPISDQNGRNWNPISDQNGYKKHTLWRGTYLYSLYKGLPPPPNSGEKRVAEYESRWLYKRD